MREWHTKHLFEEMDKNYKQFCRGKTFWKELHSLDYDLIPDGIRIETFQEAPDQPLSAKAFANGEKTVVIGLKSAKTTETGAEALTTIFKGTGIKFVAEEVSHNGQVVHQIRSNIDKAQWAKLAVFCKYRFEREILNKEGKPDKTEQANLKNDCQKAVDKYLEGTSKEWDAVEGMPAFCALMGMHGILRPEIPVKPDVDRKHEELNAKHDSGTPYLFRHIPIHVSLKRDGRIYYGHHSHTTPYVLGLDPNREAIEKSVEGGKLRSLLYEIFGYDFYYRKVPIANKFLHLGVVLVTSQALAEGRTEPLVIAAFAATGVVVGFIKNRWHYLGKQDEILKNPKLVLKKMEEQGANGSSTGIDAQALEKQACSPESMSQLENLLRDMGVIERTAAQPAKKVDDILEARLSGLFGGLRNL